MALSSVLFLFLTHLGLGMAFTLVLVSREAGVKFFRFNAGLAALLVAIGFAFRPVAATDSPWRTVAAISLIVADAGLVLYWATVGRMLAKIRPALVAVALGAGILTLVTQAFDVPTATPIASAFSPAASPSALCVLLRVASFVSSAALLGGTCGALILGHWYLILPSMDVAHLQSLVKFHIGSMVVRSAVVGAGIFVAVVTWQPGMGASFEHYILSSGGIFFWQRVLFGLAGPTVLSYLTWETAKIRSTQSATGILYVAFFSVVVGEVLAKYLLLATSVPL